MYAHSAVTSTPPNPVVEEFDNLICAITDELIDDPGRTPCGHIFELAAITEWLARNNTCPICKKVIHIEEVERDRNTKAVIEEWKAKSQHFRENHEKMQKQLEMQKIEQEERQEFLRQQNHALLQRLERKSESEGKEKEVERGSSHAVCRPHQDLDEIIGRLRRSSHQEDRTLAIREMNTFLQDVNPIELLGYFKALQVETNTDIVDISFFWTQLSNQLNNASRDKIGNALLFLMQQLSLEAAHSKIFEHEATIANCDKKIAEMDADIKKLIVSDEEKGAHIEELQAQAIEEKNALIEELEEFRRNHQEAVAMMKKRNYLAFGAGSISTLIIVICYLNFAKSQKK